MQLPALPSADGEVENKIHRGIRNVRRSGVRFDCFAVEVPRHGVTSPIAAVDVKTVAEVDAGMHVGAVALRMLRGAPMNRDDVVFRRYALPLHKIDLRWPRTIGRNDPKRGPHTLTGRQLDARFGVAVAVRKRGRRLRRS